ncbi:MAG: gamma-glutamyltransferase, partial [Pseudomonadota bacterium]
MRYPVQRDFSLPGRSPVIASECAASTSHPLATATALTILREGGNAVDAAIAACVTQCVVEPHMTGIGGDCFAIIGMADGTMHGLNGSGRSAAGAHLDWYLENGFSSIEEPSPHAVTVPGSVNAWATMHDRFGSLPFERLFVDAIRYSENGFPVGNRVAADWAEQVDKLKGNPVSAQTLLVNGKAPNAGDTFAMPNLAATLRRIAIEGKSAFYQGSVAAEIASTLQGLGGFLNEEDLANVSADWVDLISGDFQGYSLNEIPPNGQGLAAIMLVRLLEKIGLEPDQASLQRAHLEMECGRIAYTARGADHFGGLAITSAPSTAQESMTIITGQVLDQMMLLGILNRL